VHGSAGSVRPIPDLVTAAALTKRFGDGGFLRRGGGVQAVTDLTLSVQRGEALGLVGESGSGKSTIGRLLLGLLPPTSGTITFDGVSLAGADAATRRRLRRRMQLVFQDPYSSLDPRRRIGAQIADGLAIHHLVPRRARPARVAELLAQVGLPPTHAERFPHEFSGGQRQRIGIARALATGPEFLVADEPVSALDVSVQAQVLALLADLRTRLGLAMLFISHDLPVVRHLCDRVMVLYLGRVMEDGPARQVFSAPRHPYTAALLSAAPSLDPTRRRRRILLPGEPPSPARPPSGCVFRTRCPHALAQCAAEVPALRQAGPDHRFACIRDLSPPEATA
jgi:peptide/nickel transport system ATP-binding protein